MSFQRIEIRPKHSDTFPKEIDDHVVALCDLLGSEASWNFSDDVIYIESLDSKPFINIGAAIQEDIQHGLITDEIKMLYAWAKNDNITIKNICSNIYNFVYGPKTAESLFRRIDNCNYSISDIAKKIDLLNIVRQWDTNEEEWVYIELDNTQFLALCPVCEPVADMCFKEMLQLSDNCDILKEISINGDDDIESAIQLDDMIYVEHSNDKGKAYVEVFDYDFNLLYKHTGHGLVPEVSIDRYKHENLVQYYTYPQGELKLVCRPNKEILLDNR